MTAEVMQVYVAWCDACGWESETDDFESQAERYADLHNESCPHATEEDDTDPRTGREVWQDTLDKVMAAFR